MHLVFLRLMWFDFAWKMCNNFAIMAMFYCYKCTRILQSLNNILLMNYNHSIYDLNHSLKPNNSRPMEIYFWWLCALSCDIQAQLQTITPHDEKDILQIKLEQDFLINSHVIDHFIYMYKFMIWNVTTPNPSPNK